MTLYEDAVTDSVRRALDEAPGEDELATIASFAVSVISFTTLGGMKAEAVVTYGGDPAPEAPSRDITRGIDAEAWSAALADDGVHSTAHATVHYDHETRTAVYVVADDPVFLTRQKILDYGRIVFTR